MGRADHVKAQKALIYSQDQKLEHIIGGVDTLNQVAVNINQELAYQDPIVDEIQEEVEENIVEIEEQNEGLDKLLAYGSNCCLGLTIVMELLLFILIWYIFK